MPRAMRYVKHFIDQVHRAPQALDLGWPLCWPLPAPESSRILCQMRMEECFIRIAKSSGKPTVVLCDRGTMDAAAYMDSQVCLSLPLV